MKNFFKRLKASEWLIITQILFSGATLFLTRYFGNEIVDTVGLVGNIINGVAILVVFSMENAKNLKYYDLTGEFIFNKLGDSFSSFMDFLMSAEYKSNHFDEQKALHKHLIDMSRSDDYDVKRKISRALPYLYDIDRGSTVEIIHILRTDFYKDRTDIRRRTLEAALTIIQKQKNPRKQRAIASRFLPLFAYHSYDDSYTVLACIEAYYFLYEYVFLSKRDKENCRRQFASLRETVGRAHRSGIGAIDGGLCADMDNIFRVLSSLSKMRDLHHEDYEESRDFVSSVLESGGRFSKLSVVKNLFYTCEGFPACLRTQSCSASGSRQMMLQIDKFLTHALDEDVFLAMPTVRYFDCICNNLQHSESKEIARQIVLKFFSSEELLIAQTAFDKFALLAANDSALATEVLETLLHEETSQSAAQAAEISERLAALTEEQRSCFHTEMGRMKFKVRGIPASYKELPEITELVKMIESYNERIRFIGKIKKTKENKKA